MLEHIISFDQKLLLTINGWHSPFFDDFFLVFSGKIIWFPTVLLFLFVLYRHENNFKNFGWALLFIILTIVLSDQISSGIIKPFFARLRPTHEPGLDRLIHVVHGYRGGLYGFVSSHAANSFAFALMSASLLRSKPYGIAIFSWAVITSYSRMYLGVHYPGDIIGGIIIGLFFGALCFWLMNKLSPKNIKLNQLKLENKYSISLVLLIILTVTAIAIFHKTFVNIAL